MEAFFRDVDLFVQIQFLFVLNDIEIVRQSRFQVKGVNAYIVVNVDNQVIVNRNRRRFRFFRLQVIVKYYYIVGDVYCVFRQIVYYDARLRDIYAIIEGKQVWCSFEYNIWRYIYSYYRRYGDSYFIVFRRYSRSLVFNLVLVGIIVQVDFILLGSYCIGKRRAYIVKVDRKLVRLYIKRYKVVIDIYIRNLKLIK